MNDENKQIAGEFLREFYTYLFKGNLKQAANCLGIGYHLLRASFHSLKEIWNCYEKSFELAVALDKPDDMEVILLSAGLLRREIRQTESQLISIASQEAVLAQETMSHPGFEDYQHLHAELMLS